ncbi:MAG: hypothetical protein HZB42_00890 [Sphingobacteriales bacterium]|nr:hypothetical protein [Sphingobacteriales bacterium]
MRSFKAFDLFVQLILILIIAAAFIISDPEKLNPLPFILVYGGLQIISILAHFAYSNQAWKKVAWRKYHLIGTALVVAGIIFAILQSSAARSEDKDDKYNMAGLETLIYITIPAILLALFYSVITFAEWNNMRKKNI